jgi:hypothetical protein
VEITDFSDCPGFYVQFPTGFEAKTECGRMDRLTASRRRSGREFGFNDKLSARHTLIALNAIHPEGIAEISRWSPTGAPPVKKAWCHAS